MFDTSDKNTIHSTRLFFDYLSDVNKPVAIWVGAGVSSWCGYQRWEELAESFHRYFQRYEKSYDANIGKKLLEANQLPKLFQLCEDSNQITYNKLLSESFSLKGTTPVYQRFINAILNLSPKIIFTTNIDELLEKNLSEYTTLLKQDIERGAYLFKNNERFICKVHGSINNFDSIVFTESDYDELTSDSDYIHHLEHLFSLCSVIFVGYGLQDEYLVSLLESKHDLAKMFGDGPHFALLPQNNEVLPKSINVIRYKPEPHKDHRTYISALEELSNLRMKSQVFTVKETTKSSGDEKLYSAHLLYDIFPPGTWKSSQTMELSNGDGTKKQLIVGNGFTNDEFKEQRSTAMHDVLMGLLCFDQIISPVQALGRLHLLIGPQWFWLLIRENVIRIINWDVNEGMIFPSPDSISGGNLGSFSLCNPEKHQNKLIDIIKTQLQPNPGKEDEAEKLFNELEPKIQTLSDEEARNIPEMVKSLLLRPSIRESLGISSGTPLNSFPRWHVNSILRLANVVKIGATCSGLRIASAKLDFGASKLAGPAFAITSGNEWTDDVAGYVVSGRFDANIGTIAEQDPSIMHAVMKFRDTETGISLRKDILENLVSNHGSEVNVAVNSALQSSIPIKVLQQAHDRFVSLIISDQSFKTPVSALWNDNRHADLSLIKWKRKSRADLNHYCNENGVSPHDSCPCGSGERLKFCCLEALNINI